MLYVLRLTSGDCIVAAAADERSARDLAASLGLEQGEAIASARPLSQFAVRFSPTDSASLEVNSWDDSTLDDILANEYPILNQAFRAANSVRFVPLPESTRPVVEQLKEAHENNTEIICEGLRQEVDRLKSQAPVRTQKLSHK
jgi:hypothetical protein